jgi:hypothetical protein
MPTIHCGFPDAAGVSGSDLLVLHGPTVWVHIGFDPTFVPRAIPSTILNLPQTPLPALVDTGAIEGCIDNGLAMQLNLPIVDQRSVSGIHGAGLANVHLAQIYVFSLALTIHGAFCGVDLIAGGQAHHALLGRTFLRNFTLTYGGRTGAVTLSND